MPIQSMSHLIRDQIFVCWSWTLGNQRATTKTIVLIIALMLNPHRHPMVSAKTPPSTNPRENPIGCPPPIDANAMFLLLPSGKMLVMILTAEGKQKEIATPAKARNTISCVPVCASPQARVNPDWRMQPVRYIGLAPTTSAIEPRSKRVQPHVKA
jgi:hypothetical protein